MSDEAIFQAVLKAVRRLLSRCCKNVEDWLCRCVASSLCRVSAMHFLAMTLIILTIAAVLSLSMLSESRAACNLTNDDGDTVDESGNYCGTCGTDCHWALDNAGNMKITGSGKMADYTPTCVVGRKPKCTTENRPWQKYREQIKSVDIQGITNVGVGAFYYIPITDLTLGNTITSLGTDAFEQHHLQTIELPGSLTTIGDQALISAFNRSPTVILPDTLNIPDEKFERILFYSDTLSNVICRGDSAKCNNIKNKLLGYGYAINFSLADSSNCESSHYYWSGSSCNNKKNGINCDENWKQVETWCNRIRYTPAEAAQYLKDTDNEIIMTFKVNR